MALSAMAQGMVLGASMIIPIGAQNSFILSQGIRRNHHYLIASICLFCDVVLTLIGVFGGAKLINSNDILLALIGGGGILFLSIYALIAFRRAWQFNYSNGARESTGLTRKTAIVATLAVTLLNPHVYLDTVVILGSVGGTFSDDARLYFAVGCILAATMWFYSLAAGASKLAPLLAKPKNQRKVDMFIGLVMAALAIRLFVTFFV